MAPALRRRARPPGLAQGPAGAAAPPSAAFTARTGALARGRPRRRRAGYGGRADGHPSGTLGRPACRALRGGRPGRAPGIGGRGWEPARASPRLRRRAGRPAPPGHPLRHRRARLGARPQHPSGAGAPSIRSGSTATTGRLGAADLRRSAYHEAGHGLGFERTGSAHVVQVDLVQRRDSVGATSAVPGLGPSPTRKEIEGLVVALLSGRAAEIAFLGEPSAGAGGDVTSDLARATTLLAGAHASLGLGEGLAYRGAPHEVAVGLTLDPRLLDAVERDLARLGSEALALVEANRAVVEAVAELLVEGRVVSGDTLRALIAEADQTRAARDGGHA
ncbi:hypothetical protein [Methylobacterium oryzae]|uniref:hypothetical protein n=1 Tax=Methylobacterium oryzae TaxID=334852 RepID=UPI002F35F811